MALGYYVHLFLGLVVYVYNYIYIYIYHFEECTRGENCSFPINRNTLTNSVEELKFDLQLSRRVVRCSLAVVLAVIMVNLITFYVQIVPSGLLHANKTRVLPDREIVGQLC